MSGAGGQAQVGIELTFAADPSYLVFTLTFLRRGLELKATVRPEGLRLEALTPCCRSFQAWPGDGRPVRCGACSRAVPASFLPRWNWLTTAAPSPLVPYLEALLVECSPVPGPLAAVLEASMLEARILALTGPLDSAWAARWADLPSAEQARALAAAASRAPIDSDPCPV